MTTGRREPVLGEFAREHDQLVALLEERADAARRRIEALPAARLTDGTDAEIAARCLDQWRSQIGTLVLGAGQVDTEPENVLQRGPSGGERVWKWRVRYSLTGNVRLLHLWPTSLDEQTTEAPNEPGTERAELSIEASDSDVAVVCTVRATDDPDGTRPPTTCLRGGDAYLRNAVEAFDRDIDAFAVDLAPVLEKAARSRRARLDVVSKSLEPLVELVRRPVRPITIEQSIADASDARDDAVELGTTISRESFDDLLDAVKRWRSGVERYPQALSSLNEEDITSIVVATLGTVFANAGRETFQRLGKTDIFVSGSVPGSRAHIAEAKIWKGPARVAEAVKQILGYATARSEALLLLWYVQQLKLAPVRIGAKKALAEIDAVTHVDEDDTGDFIVRIVHPDMGQHLSLHVLFVHLGLDESRRRAS